MGPSRNSICGTPKKDDAEWMFGTRKRPGLLAWPREFKEVLDPEADLRTRIQSGGLHLTTGLLMDVQKVTSCTKNPHLNGHHGHQK
jgi:hypothetical protein